MPMVTLAGSLIERLGEVTGIGSSRAATVAVDNELLKVLELEALTMRASSSRSAKDW